MVPALSSQARGHRTRSRPTLGRLAASIIGHWNSKLGLDFQLAGLCSGVILPMRMPLPASDRGDAVTTQIVPTKLPKLPPTTTASPVAVYLASLSAGSRRTMARALETIARMTSRDALSAKRFTWHPLRHEHTAAIRARLPETYAPATANKHLSALRGVLEAAWRLGLMDAEAFHREADIRSIRGEADPPGRSVNAGELRALLTACADDRTAAGRRNAALITIAFGCALSRAEIVGLDLHDYDAETGALRIRRAKGRKNRIVYVGNGAKDALDDLLPVRGSESGPLFMPIDKDRTIRPRPLTTQAVYVILEKRAKQAGVKRFSPHDCQRTFAGDLLDSGCNIGLVQRLMGHASVTTTAKYDRRPDQAKRKAIESLHVPYLRPRVT